MHKCLTKHLCNAIITTLSYVNQRITKNLSKVQMYKIKNRGGTGMSLVKVKCPHCGTDSESDNMKDLAICKHCGQLYDVEEAINNYNTVNIFPADVNDDLADSYCIALYGYLPKTKQKLKEERF